MRDAKASLQRNFIALCDSDPEQGRHAKAGLFVCEHTCAGTNSQFGANSWT